ncbi:hypothetical protein [Gordonia hankookensis]|uniref:Uncharacterized protein n=1 Tax=Gordonia hankookensis TaxID=589403 RepID=A0ABR7WDF4_9ACTN|nr:hypothetical protein [Gordonia hankookensis]MBD1319769.1 hypothetical protein [Gordonia hankookensis]
MLVALGAIGVAFAFVLGAQVLALVFVALAMIVVPVYLPKRTKLRTGAQHLLIYRQPFYTNGWLWMTFVFMTMTGGIVGQVVVGATQSWRIAILAVPALVGVVLTAVLAYRYRGPLKVTATTVTSGSGHAVALDTAVIDFVRVEHGAPSIRLTPPTGKVLLVASVPYNIDFDTMLSTFEQLRSWNSQGRITSPAEIEAMLRAARPEGIAVGESVELTVPVGGGS